MVGAELLGGLLGGIAVGQDEQLPGVRVEGVRLVGGLVFGHPAILQGAIFVPAETPGPGPRPPAPAPGAAPPAPAPARPRPRAPLPAPRVHRTGQGCPYRVGCW
ncbi:hypothetical protein GCM10010505_58660 [Kitasatospora aburaviensis]